MRSKQIRDRIAVSTGLADAGKVVCTDADGRIAGSLIQELKMSQILSTGPLITPGGRLTLSSTEAVADGTTATELYYLPHIHNIIPVWTGSYWQYWQIPETGLAMPNLTTLAAGSYDLFARYNNGYVIEYSSWSTSTARLNDLVRQDGTWISNNGLIDRWIYLGTVRLLGTTGSIRYNDHPGRRYVFNAYNQVRKPISRIETTASWTYSGSAWRSWNNSNSNRIELLDGLGTGVVDATFTARISPGSGFGQIGIGVDTTTTHTDGLAFSSGVDTTVSGYLCRSVGLGQHYLQALESANGTVATTFYGQSRYGLQGSWWC